MGAYEDELEALEEELNNGEISMSEYNKRLRDIEQEEAEGPF